MARTEPPIATTLLILAGGASRRMGRDKASHPFPGPTDPPLISAIRDRLCPLTVETVIAGPEDFGLGCHFVGDTPPGIGPLGGLIAGMAAVRTELLLAVAVDLPLASRELAQELIEIARQTPEADAVVPQARGRLEPLFAVYRKRALGALQEGAQAREGRGPSLQRAMAGLRLELVPEERWRRWDPQGLSFWNCNTPAELSQAARLLTSTDDQEMGLE